MCSWMPRRRIPKSLPYSTVFLTRKWRTKMHGWREFRQIMLHTKQVDAVQNGHLSFTSNTISWVNRIRSPLLYRISTSRIMKCEAIMESRPFAFISNIWNDDMKRCDKVGVRGEKKGGAWTTQHQHHHGWEEHSRLIFDVEDSRPS